MGTISDAMINGEMCALCGVYLEPKEKVYTQASGKKMNMPSDGSPAGFPVICKDCHDE
jgi:hypothetical protein